MERLRKHANEKLSTSQLKIFDQISFAPGLTTAEAAAGAGKTRTLSYLVLKAMLLEDEVKQVFILTSTRTAKDEAFARVNKLHSDLGFDLNGECEFLNTRNVRTIHSICLGAARDDAAEEGGAGVSVVSGSAIKEMLCEIIEEIKSKNPRCESGREHDSEDSDVEYEHVSNDDVISLSESTIEEVAVLLKNVRSERLHSCVDVVDDSFGSIAKEALTALEQRLGCDTETGMVSMDFDAMTESFRASQKSIVFPGDVLFVDEAQDLTRCQLGILMNTLRAGGCVVVLGDDSQGIFQFSGACDQTLRALKERARSASIPVKRFALMQNHRSTNSIVAAAESLLPFHDRANRIGVCGNGTVGDPVEASLFKSESDEAEAIATRAVDLVAGGQFAADQIVILRHKNWTWGHPIVNSMRQIAAGRGVEINVAIAGQDATNSLEGKFLAVLQVGIDMERFCEPATEGLDMIKTFVKSMRGKGWNQKLGFRAVETVYQRHLSSDPAAIFTRYREELLSEFRLEEAKDDAEMAEKEARKGTSAKRKRVISTGGPTIKEKNFESIIRVAGKAITGIRERVRGIELGKRTLDPIVVAPQIDFFARDKSKPPESTYPTLNAPLGGLAWLILRDVVSHEYSTADAFQIQEIVSTFDFEFEKGGAEDVVDVVSESVSKLAAKVHDKSTQGKLVLSTIHKYKGRENEVAFVCALSNPWGSPDWPRRATLSSEHTHDCTNRSGKRTECCGPFKQGIDRLKEAQTAEKLRLFYVGASRAKQRLFLSGFQSPYGDSFHPLCEMTGGQKGEFVEICVR